MAKRITLDVLGLDIGGANLKSAHTNMVARSVPFALWKAPNELTGALRSLVADMPRHDLLAVTMTGELCDCFADKREGVREILGSVAETAGETPVRVWTTRGEFISLQDAREAAREVAAANWLAAATLAGNYARESAALFMDVGSTTTDIVPLWHGTPMPFGKTDTERLRSGELVYTGARRTPVCALLGPYVAAEFFATSLDAYLLLDMVPENEHDRDTADGKPATKNCAHVRLARMIGGDGITVSREETMALAKKIMERQVERIAAGVSRVRCRMPETPRAIVLAGSGEFLATAVVSRLELPTLSMAQLLTPALSEAICAYAVALLAQRVQGPERERR